MSSPPSWFLPGLAVTTLVVVGLTAVLVLGEDGPAEDDREAVVVRPGVVTHDSGAALSAAVRPEAQRAETGAARPTDVPDSRISLPFIKGAVIDRDSQRPVRDFRVWVLPHDTTPVFSRQDDVDPERFAEATGIFRSEQEPGSYDVIVEAPGYVPQTALGVVVPATDRKPVRFPLSAGAGIEGVVLSDTGLAAPDVSVFLDVTRLAPGSERPRQAVARSNREGRFRFSPLDPGEYAVTPLSPDNKADRVPALRVDVDRLTPVTLHLSSRHQVTLQIRDPQGRPVEGALVELAGPGQVASGRSTEAGLVVLDHLDDGQYALRVQHDAYLPVAEDLQLSGGFGRTVRWIPLTRPPR